MPLVLSYKEDLSEANEKQESHNFSTSKAFFFDKNWPLQSINDPCKTFKESSRFCFIYDESNDVNDAMIL